MNLLLNLIFPPKCVSCGTAPQYLCTKCKSKINFTPIQRCTICNLKSTGGITHPRCITPWAINGIWAIMKNQSPTKELIYQLKYQYSTDIHHTIFNLIKLNIPNFLYKFDLIIPMPLSVIRLKWRGFNQTKMITELISKQISIPTNDKILFRKPSAKTQVSIKSRKLRLKNIKNEFILPNRNKHLIKNKNIILFDDIATTGSTLKQAAIALKRTNANKVWGLVLAR